MWLEEWLGRQALGVDSEADSFFVLFLGGLSVIALAVQELAI